jgi:GrpB-like predicted nucleotidyltransferase (UPF0157 family)
MIVATEHAPLQGPALGLVTGTVSILPYDPRWPELFEEAAAELRAVTGSALLDVQHVGSTSVPGLAAKPVLDILAAVSDFEAALELVPAIESLGYQFRPDEEIPDRHYFRRRVGVIRTHHLSLAEPASRYHRVTIAFRDALRADPDLARQYQALKLELAARYPSKRDAYTGGKTGFVQRVLSRLMLDAPTLSRAGPA